MAEILVLGGGVAGLSTALLLARDGHRVTVVERDPEPPPSEPEQAWQKWERRGVGQFRHLHYFLPRFRMLLESELPEVARAAGAAGALRMNVLAGIPPELAGAPQDGDERLMVLTARRPVMEAALAGAAAATEGVELRRGTAVKGLLSDGPGPGGVSHVCGIRTEGGDDLRADLVVDASGRRSALPSWLSSLGGPPPQEEADDSGFAYYGRHFRSPDGSLPPVFGPLLEHHGSVSTLTLPADNGTWGVGLVVCSSDAALRPLGEVDRWEAALARFPSVAHWAHGESISQGVTVMARLEDRIRRLVVEGAPVVTGVVAVGDAWACTNPSVGRGASMALLHACELRDLLRSATPGDATGFALAWDVRTREAMEPWYQATVAFDRHRLAEAHAATRGEPHEPGDRLWETWRALEHAAILDPELLRALLRIMGLLARADEVLTEPSVAQKAAALGGSWREAPAKGPSRAELVELLAG